MEDSVVVVDVDVDVDGTKVRVEGPAEAPVLLMIHGWPDTGAIWRAQVARFRSTYRCGTFTFPGSDIDQPRTLASVEEFVASLASIIDAVSPDEPVILLGHDWGSAFSSAYASLAPERVRAVILLDVGDANSPELQAECSRLQSLMGVSYRAVLAWAWRRGGRLGDAVTRLVARVLAPGSDQGLVFAGMNGPYEATRSAGADLPVLGRDILHPTLFVYGANKPLAFHSTAWVERLGARADCAVHRFRTGHWLMLDAPDQLNRVIAEWLDEGGAGRKDQLEGQIS